MELRSDSSSGGNMNVLKLCICFGVLTMCALSLCTKMNYSSPIDKEGSIYWGDSAAADDNGDGIANFYDSTSAWYKNHQSEIFRWSMSTITFKDGDTVIMPQNDPNGVIRNLKNQATAFDSVYGDLSSQIKMEGIVYSSKCTTYTLVYNVTNLANVTARKNRTVIVDCSPPVLTILGKNPDSIIVETTYVDSGATAIDNVDGTIQSINIIKTPATLNTSRERTDTVTYTVYDRARNKQSAQRIVVIYKPIVRDTIAPFIRLLGSSLMTLKVGDTFTDPGDTAWDNNDGNITSKVVKTGSVNTMVAGTYYITYSVSDNANNPADPKTRTVSVTPVGTDSTPVIRLKGKNPDSVKVLVGGAYVDSGCTASDPSGDLTAGVKVSELYGKPLPISTDSIGTYVLVYSVTGKTGKPVSATRYVYVVSNSTDNFRPEIFLQGPNPVTVFIRAMYIDAGAKATDNVDTGLTSKIKATLTTAAGATASMTTFTSTAGQYIITYTVSDNSGNTAIPKIRNILVEDTTGNGVKLTIKYGVPLKTPLPIVPNITYKTISSEGKGAPAVASIKDFIFAWRNSTVDNFAIDLTVSPYYVDLKPKITQTFAQASPGFTLTGSGVNGLDGSYYIAASETQCVWVKTDGSYAIVFKP